MNPSLEKSHAISGSIAARTRIATWYRVRGLDLGVERRVLLVLQRLDDAAQRRDAFAGQRRCGCPWISRGGSAGTSSKCR